MLQRYGSMIAMQQPMECWTKIRLGNLRKTCVLCSFTCDVSQRVACNYAILRVFVELHCDTLPVLLLPDPQIHTPRDRRSRFIIISLHTACLYQIKRLFLFTYPSTISPSLSLHGHLVTCDMGIYPPAIKHGDGTSPINFKVSIMETSSESSVYKSRGTSIYCGYHWCILLVL